MGQLITTVIGGAIGFMIGGPMGAKIGMMLGGMIGQSLFGPTIHGPRLSDLKVSASTYGVAIPEIYGTVRLGGNMIWTTGLHETKKKSGGKGGPKQVSYSYDCTFATAICKGPIDDILRIWADSKLIYDVAGGSTRLIGNANFAELILSLTKGKAKKKKNIKMRVYRGTEDQMPDSLIEADKGAGKVSAHRGIAYVVFEKLPLEDYGNRVPQLTFEVTKRISNNMPNMKAVETPGVPLPLANNRQWIPDWELGRLYSFSFTPGSTATTTDVLDINTMQRVYGTDFTLFFGGQDRAKYVPGNALLFREYGNSNSRPMGVWDMLTINQIDKIGQECGSLDGQYLNSCGRPINCFAALGEMGVCWVRTGGQRKLHLLMIGWTRAVWAFNYGEDTPIFYAKAAFTPTSIVTGRQDGSQSEMIGWRGANSRLEMEIWNITAGAAGGLNEQPPPSGCGASPSYIWEPSTDYNRYTLNLTPFPGEAFVPNTVLYDPTDDHLFVVGKSAGTACFFKYSLINNTYKFKVKHPIGLYGPAMEYTRLAGGSYGWGAGITGTGAIKYWNEIDLQTGALLRNDLVDESEFGSRWYFGAWQEWDDQTSSLLVGTADGFRRVFFRSGAEKLGVSEVVQDICQRTGILTAADLDVTELENSELVGYTIDRETTTRDVLKQLATAFLFDGYESDYKLKFRSRGNSSIVTIPESWISRDGENIVVRETLTQELELPMRITVNYYDTTRDHQQGSQTMKRNAAPYPSMWTRKEDVIDLPITWTPDDAKQCADKLLKMSWANRTGYGLTLPWKYLKYDPTDVATINLEDGTIYEVRFSEMTIGADFKIAAAGASEKAAAYVSNAVGQISPSPDQGIPVGYPAYPIIVNTPLLRDIDYDTTTNSTCYVAVGTYALTYTGAQVYMSDGFEFDAIGSTDIEGVSGICANALPNTSATESTDETTVLRVRLSDSGATLESVTQEEMLTNYANAALVGNEVIQFRDAVLQVDGTWWLTGLLRARRGTNYASKNHTTGEQFLLLDIATMTKFARPPETYVTTRDFKALTLGDGLLEDVIPYPASLIPRDLMPYSPEDIKVTDDGTDVKVSMSRRSRVTAALVGGTGTIHYKEGEKASAKISYKLWPGLTIADTATIVTPPFTGNIPLFNSSGIDIPNEVIFPLTNLGSETKFLISLTEVGIVDGTPKWVGCERIGANLWNITELY